jgi:hypothetical protein
MIKTENHHAFDRATSGLEVHLDLTVTDRETVSELLKYGVESARDDYALSALKVGVLAIRQACGVVDAQSIHQECQRFLDLVGKSLATHADSMTTNVGNLLGKYFDPASGELPQRIDRLVRRDGELESLLGKHLNGDGSVLSLAMEKHIGPSSPFFQMLSPDQRKGILGALKESLELVLGEHGKSLARQFSLDDKDSALSRLVGEITEKNGALRNDLSNDLDRIRKEFSLDNDEGALARLVGRVEKAHRTILSEFSADNEQSALNKMAKLLDSTNKNIDSSLSLDQEDSPLCRLRREIVSVIDGMSKANAEFQEQVRVTLESLKVRRAEAARSTTHGLDFQDVVGEFVQQQSQRLGDLFESTDDSAGAISRCKVGDFVVTLGPDSAAPDARIVFEAKEDRSYTLKEALAELQKARENRAAQVGVFVFSREAAPVGIEPLGRFGHDVVLVWDAEDPQTDIVFKSAISVARMIAVQERKVTDEAAADITEMKQAIDALCRDVSILDDIIKCASAAQNHCEKIVTKAGGLKKKIDSNLSDLHEHVEALASIGEA